MKVIFFIPFALVLFINSCSINDANQSKADNSFVFNSGDRICFVGNSITHAGGFHHDILLYHITRFPGKPISMFNCGIAGDVTYGVLDRMNDDILSNSPTHVVVMLGMNDVQRELYGASLVNNDIINQRELAIAVYKENLEEIVNIFLEKKVKVILQRPSIYDQTAILPEPNKLGVNDALGKCALFIDSLALAYNLPVVDYFTIMNSLNIAMQKVDSSKTITSKDRIHPQVTGHLVMAYKFLKTEGAPKYVSKIVIDNNKLNNINDCYNCEIDSVLTLKDGITFLVKEYALPFPTTKEQQDGLKLVPFYSELNIELLKVNNLPKGNYQLYIDDQLINTYSVEQLSAGVNLAKEITTPQYQQSERVLVTLNKLWGKEAELRGLKFIEYSNDYKSCPDKADLKFVETYLDSVFTVKYDGLSYGAYYKKQLKKYLSDKPKEDEFIRSSNMLREEAYKVAQPKAHTFVITAK